MSDKAMLLLGLMKKANALQVGEENTGVCVHSGKARLVMYASDASDNAVRRVTGYVDGTSLPLLKLPYDKMELAAALGSGPVSMLAVSDLGFSAAFLKSLDELFPERYSDALQMVVEKQKQLAARKQKKPAKRKKTTRRL